MSTSTVTAVIVTVIATTVLTVVWLWWFYFTTVRITVSPCISIECQMGKHRDCWQEDVGSWLFDDECHCECHRLH